MARGLWEKKQKKCIFHCWAWRWFLLFYFPKPRCQVWILTHRNYLLVRNCIWFHLFTFYKSPCDSLYLKSVAWELGILQQVNFAWLGKWRFVFKEGNQLFKNVWEQFFITSNPLRHNTHSNGKNVTFISFSKSISLPHRRNETLVTPVCETVPKSLLWVPICGPGFEYAPWLACSKSHGRFASQIERKFETPFRYFVDSVGGLK